MTPPYGSIPSPLDEAIRARFDLGGTISFKTPLDDAAMQWWHDKLGAYDLYPRELAEALTGGTGFDRTFEFQIGPGPEEIRLITRAYDNGVEAFVSGRSLLFDEKVIHLDKTTVQDGYKGLKVGSTLLGNAYRLLLRIEFDQLELLAAWDGAYVWARAGFLLSPKTWAEKDKPDRLRQPIKDRLEQIGWGELPPVKKSALLRILDEDHEPTMLWRLVEVEGKVTSARTPPDKVKLPWSLLAETEASWYGYLHREDAAAVARLQTYLRRNAAKGTGA
ncbi:hypothetical protein [Methylobacterium sp. 22177]|uniref:hypothetical protein n=1 Tax=Methylobacterium sp. 22177 TaxID=3453885 RepID=UPI003F877BBF